MKLFVKELDFLDKKCLPLKFGKLTKNEPKQGFLNLLKKLVINFF